MRKGVILFVENVMAFLITRKEFLEQEGYEVLPADSPEAAKKILQDRHVHMAIIDLRLRRDGDKNDFSGLELVKELDPALPKIILTAYPKLEIQREVLLKDAEGRQLVDDFVAKQDGPEEMLRVVNRVFAQCVRINWGLTVEWPRAECFALLARIAPLLEGETFLQQAVELEELFLRLFYERSRIQIERLLWARAGRAALTVYAWSHDQHCDPLLVVCGPRELMAAELSRYQEFAPKVTGHAGTLLENWARTLHFAAHLYTLVNLDLDNAVSLESLYRYGSERAHAAALRSVVNTFNARQATPRPARKGKTLAELFRACLVLTDDRVTQASLTAQVAGLVRQLPADEVNIESNADTIAGSFDGRRFSYPNPALMLSAEYRRQRPFFQITTSGRLTGENILLDKSGRAWLTDFADAGLAPLAWNYVELEALIRFDWTEPVPLQSLYLMEQRLVTGDFLKFRCNEIERPLSKTLLAIHLIRSLAVRALGGDLTSYRIGLLFAALSRVVGIDADRPLRRAALLRSGHALLAAAMLSEWLVQHKEDSPPSRSPAEAGLRIDEASGDVWIDGECLEPLSPRSFALLSYLYQHPQHTGTRRNLIEDVLGLRYEENNQGQVNHLHQAIFKLRTELGSDGARYVRNVKRGRYCLVLNPKE